MLLIITINIHYFIFSVIIVIVVFSIPTIWNHHHCRSCHHLNGLCEAIKRQSPALRDLLARMLAWDQDARITAEGALEHEVIRIDHSQKPLTPPD